MNVKQFSDFRKKVLLNQNISYEDFESLEPEQKQWYQWTRNSLKAIQKMYEYL